MLCQLARNTSASQIKMLSFTGVNTEVHLLPYQTLTVDKKWKNTASLKSHIRKLASMLKLQSLTHFIPALHIMIADIWNDLVILSLSLTRTHVYIHTQFQ